MSGNIGNKIDSVLLTKLQTTELSSNEHVFRRSDSIPVRKDVIWRIEQGIVRAMTWYEDGTNVSLGYWGKGDLIGQPLSDINPYQLVCLSNVELVTIPPQRWHEEMEGLLSHIRQSEKMLSLVQQKPLSLRLKNFLLWMANKFGREEDEGVLIDASITHQEIAEALNTTRVTITRLFSEFEQEGIIARRGRRISLLKK